MKKLSEEEVNIKLNVAVTASFIYCALAYLELFVLDTEYNLIFKVLFWLVYVSVFLTGLGVFFKDKRCAVIQLVLFVVNIEQFLIYGMYIDFPEIYFVIARGIVALIIIFEGIVNVLKLDDNESELLKEYNIILGKNIA
jgi:hypothetical protein